MKNAGRIGFFAIVIVLVVVLFMSFATINSGTVGVVTYFGAVQKATLGEGVHFVIPFMTNVIHMNVRVQKVEAEATASSKDLQTVTSKVALNYLLSQEKAHVIYQKLGLDYRGTIIEPTIQESVKSATAQYTAEQLITRRSEVKESIFNYVKKRLGSNNIIVTDFSIIDFSFSPEFNKAIERKQVAEQQALTAKNDLTRIKTEAEQAIARAKGQADAQKLLQEAIDDRLLQLKAIEKWNGVLPVVSGGNSSSFVDLSAILKK